MKKKLITLAKELDFTYESEYFDYLIDSYINGNLSQCKELFNAMEKDSQKQFILYLKNGFGLDKEFYFYFNLL